MKSEKYDSWSMSCMVNNTLKDYITKPSSWLDIVSCIIIYLLVMIVLNHINLGFLNAFLSIQFQFLIFTILIIRIRRLGLLTACMITIATAIFWRSNSIISIIIPLSIISTMIIIDWFVSRLQKQEANLQNDLFSLLSKEIITTQYELEKKKIALDKQEKKLSEL